MGTLYVVATPIGNVDDVTPRALEVLRSVDRVLCEDTRRTRRLLDRLGVHNRLISHHEHNERVNESRRIAELLSGDSLAIVTDAGTPGVSDPGYRLVRAALGGGIRVVPIPGASAVLAALVASGLPPDRFCFLGYLPPRRSRRDQVLEEVGPLRVTLVVFEAPHRLRATLEDLGRALGDRRAALCRELTKLHEETIRGSLRELAEWAGSHPVRGEFTIVVEGRPDEETGIRPERFTGLARQMFDRLLAEGATPDEAARQTREVFGG